MPKRSVALVWNRTQHAMVSAESALGLMVRPGRALIGCSAKEHRKTGAAIILPLFHLPPLDAFFFVIYQCGESFASSPVPVRRSALPDTEYATLLRFSSPCLKVD